MRKAALVVAGLASLTGSLVLARAQESPCLVSVPAQVETDAVSDILNGPRGPLVVAESGEYFFQGSKLVQIEDPRSDTLQVPIERVDSFHNVPGGMLLGTFRGI